MHDETFYTWLARQVEADRQLMLIRAAKDHPQGFTNPEEIGMGWTQKLNREGYASLCPFARNTLAKKYLEYQEDAHIRNVVVH